MLREISVFASYPQTTLSIQWWACLEECLKCHAACTQAREYSRARGGRYLESVHLRLLDDCAESCLTMANFLRRGSNWAPQYAALCAQVCGDCARDCERYAVSALGSGAPMSNYSDMLCDDPERADAEMKACATACRACARACRALAETILPRGLRT